MMRARVGRAYPGSLRRRLRDETFNPRGVITIFFYLLPLADARLAPKVR